MSAALSPSLVDIGRPAPASAPLAVIVPLPGLRPVAYDVLARHLEAGGYNAVLFSLPEDPAAFADATTGLVGGESTPPMLWVVHGTAGRLAVPADACAVAMLGAPLRPRAAPWQYGEPATALGALYPFNPDQSGYPASWMVPLSPSWAAALLDTAPQLLPENVPVWLGYAPLDEYAPPESRPPADDNHTVVRFGMLAGWRHDARAVDLLLDSRPANALLRWARPWCADAHASKEPM